MFSLIDLNVLLNIFSEHHVHNYACSVPKTLFLLNCKLKKKKYEQIEKIVVRAHNFYSARYDPHTKTFKLSKYIFCNVIFTRTFSDKHLYYIYLHEWN